MLKHQKIVDEAMAYLRDVAETIRTEAFRDFALSVLADPEFATAWGASVESKNHHSFRGGLACHTAEVLRGALNLANAHPGKVDLELLITAAITHDQGKIFDYDENGKKTDFYRLVRHLPFAPMRFVGINHAEKGIGVPWERFVNLTHTLLAHHGRREWGSPVEPQTIEAHILHYADMMSANFGATKDLTEDGETPQTETTGG